MSYSIDILEHIVYVTFTGDSDPLDLISLMSEPLFLPNVAKLQRLVFDFSQTTDLNMSLDEVRQLSVVAKVEATFLSTLHIVIVLSGPNGRPRAEAYQQALSRTTWRIDIVETKAQAATLLAIATDR